MDVKERLEALRDMVGDVYMDENINAIEKKLNIQTKTITADQNQIAKQNKNIRALRFDLKSNYDRVVELNAKLRDAKFTEEQVEEMIGEAIKKTEKSFLPIRKNSTFCLTKQGKKIAMLQKALELMAEYGNKDAGCPNVEINKFCLAKEPPCIKCWVDHFTDKAKKELE